MDDETDGWDKFGLSIWNDLMRAVGWLALCDDLIRNVTRGFHVGLAAGSVDSTMNVKFDISID